MMRSWRTLQMGACPSPSCSWKLQPYSNIKPTIYDKYTTNTKAAHAKLNHDAESKFIDQIRYFRLYSATTMDCWLAFCLHFVCEPCSTVLELDGCCAIQIDDSCRVPNVI